MKPIDPDKALARNILDGAEGDLVGAVTVISYAARELMRMGHAIHTECTLESGEVLHIVLFPPRETLH